MHIYIEEKKISNNYLIFIKIEADRILQDHLCEILIILFFFNCCSENLLENTQSLVR